MARHNLVFLLGYVSLVQIHQTSSSEPYALCYLTVARGPRKVGDNRMLMKCDNPLIMSRDPDIIREMSQWETLDVVEVKGMLAAKSVGKSSYCSNCGEKNIADGWRDEGVGWYYVAV